MVQVIRAKLHGLRVTGADLHYHGSITLDPEHCTAAGIYPTEFVEVWNKNSGARLSTYVIFGEPGSRCCILNGAAARTCQRGDELIIAAADNVAPQDLYTHKPKVVTFLPDNAIDQVLAYEVFKSDARDFDFRIVDLQPSAAGGTAGKGSVTNYPYVDIRAIREDLKKSGMNPAEIDGFIRKHLTR
ncbi:MAG: aspartate 1-decarboxylase [Rhodobacteraceae bacterium]|nr:aspartate 1-decarboxylase [Paracoccaceae bacterium]